MAITPTVALSYLLGGLLLLAYGVHLTSTSLRRAIGTRLQHWSATLARHAPLAFVAGVAVTTFTQSSSTVSSLLVGFVSAQLLPLETAIVMLLGANVGSTVVVQLLVWRVTDYAVGLAGLGAMLALLSRRGPWRDLGQVGFGLGLVLLGLAALGIGAAPLAQSPVTGEVLRTLAESPLVLALIGALLAVAFASSAAVIGLVVVLTGGGALPLAAALAVILGANVGATAPALVAAVGGGPPGRRLAAVHSGAKLAGAAAALAALDPLAVGLAALPVRPELAAALAHLGFNLALALVGVPLARPLARLATRAIPSPAAEAAPSALDPETLPAPAVALGLATREVLRMADLTTEMLRLSITAFEEDGSGVADRVAALDDQLDDLEAAIKHYLTQLDEEAMTEEEARREVALLYIVTDLEAIGDIIDKQLMRLARRKRRGLVAFSADEWAGLRAYHFEVLAALQGALAALAAHDAAIATEVLARKAALGRTKRELHRRHLHRLHLEPAPNLTSSALQLDVLNAMSRVLSHTSSIAHAVRGDL